MRDAFRALLARGEAGFTLVEALVSTGLLAMAVMGFMACCMVALRGIDRVRADEAMESVAHNALVDLYAVTAYDASAANALEGRTLTYASGSYTVSVSVLPEGSGKIVASVHVSDAFGHVTAMSGILAQAAPAPGSFFIPAYVPEGVAR